MIEFAGWKQVEEIYIMRSTAASVTAQSYVVFEWQGTTSSPRRHVVAGPAYTMPKPEVKA